MPTVDLGIDLSSFQGDDGAPDIDPLGPPMTGERVALEGIARRLNTPAGSLFHAGLDDYGFDIMSLAGKAMSPVAIKRAELRIQQEAEKEQGVIGVTATITRADLTTFRVALSVRLASGPYPLVLDVTKGAVTVPVLRADHG